MAATTTRKKVAKKMKKTSSSSSSLSLNSPVVPVVIKVRDRSNAASGAVKVVQQGGEAEGGVQRRGERASAVVACCFLFVVEVEVELGRPPREELRSGHRVLPPLLFSGSLSSSTKPGPTRAFRLSKGCEREGRRKEAKREGEIARGWKRGNHRR